MTGVIRDIALPLVSILLGAGALAWLRDGIRAGRKRISETTPERAERRAVSDDLDNASKSSLLLIRDNTALAARNEQLYAELTNADLRHVKEIDRLELRLRGLLDELVQLKTRPASAKHVGE